MSRMQRAISFSVGLCALFALASAAPAATIVKLNLGEVRPDISMNAAGVLSTVSDGNAATTGDQDTAIEYTAFLDPLFADVVTPVASFTLNNLQANGPAQVISGIVLQNYLGGSLSLYDPSNNLLLSGALTTSTLSGGVASSTGVVFTTSFGAFTGGSLLPYLVPSSLNMTMSLSSINNGAGLAVLGEVLQPFTSDAFVNIAAEWTGVPEPTSVMLLLVGSAFAAAARRRAARR